MEGRVLEATLLDLIAPDNEAIARATAEIEHAKKQAPTCVVHVMPLQSECQRNHVWVSD